MDGKCWKQQNTSKQFELNWRASSCWRHFSPKKFVTNTKSAHCQNRKVSQRRTTMFASFRQAKEGLIKAAWNRELRERERGRESERESERVCVCVSLSHTFSLCTPNLFNTFFVAFVGAVSVVSDASHTVIQSSELRLQMSLCRSVPSHVLFQPVSLRSPSTSPSHLSFSYTVTEQIPSETEQAGFPDFSLTGQEKAFLNDMLQCSTSASV